jgi:hypothetical protein
MEGRAEFGLSGFSASRGVDTLEEAGSVSTVRRSGRSPVVTIRNPSDGPGPHGRTPADSQVGWVIKTARVPNFLAANRAHSGSDPGRHMSNWPASLNSRVCL